MSDTLAQSCGGPISSVVILLMLMTLGPARLRARLKIQEVPKNEVHETYDGIERFRTLNDGSDFLLNVTSGGTVQH